jgi:hypothetical protein
MTKFLVSGSGSIYKFEDQESLDLLYQIDVVDGIEFDHYPTEAEYFSVFTMGGSYQQELRKEVMRRHKDKCQGCDLCREG